MTHCLPNGPIEEQPEVPGPQRAVVGRGVCDACGRQWKARAGTLPGTVLHECDRAIIDTVPCGVHPGGDRRTRPK